MDFRSGFDKKKKKEGLRSLSRSLFYLRLRSTYSDAASADTAAIAKPLNSGTGMFDCSNSEPLHRIGRLLFHRLPYSLLLKCSFNGHIQHYFRNISGVFSNTSETV